MNRERFMKAAKEFGITDKILKLEKELCEINGVIEVDFDLDGFYSDIFQVIFLPKYDDAEITRSYEGNYFQRRMQFIEKVSEVAESHDLKKSGDTIEDYGQHFYIVMDCGDSWKNQRKEPICFCSKCGEPVMNVGDWGFDDYEKVPFCLKCGNELHLPEGY